MNASVEYLAARQVADNHALNESVFQTFEAAIQRLEGDSANPLHIVEVGGGIGTMVVRLLIRGVLRGDVNYRLIDRDPACIGAAREWLPAQLRSHGYTVTRTETEIVVQGGETDATDSLKGLTLELETVDAFSTRRTNPAVDCVIGSALFDIVSLDRAIPWIESALQPSGILYAPLTYNGRTKFMPGDPYDRSIEREYHRHMDEVRATPGGSEAGQDLSRRIEQSDVLALEALGGSNWEIDAGDGREQLVVIDTVLDIIESALGDLRDSPLNERDHDRWIARRRQELYQAELRLHASHLDLLGRKTNHSTR